MEFEQVKEYFEDGKRYNSAVGSFRRLYGERLQKLVIDAGFSCPNRDGKVSTGGCTYCDNAAFHPGYSTASKPIARQIDEGIEFHKVRYRNTRGYLAYFQSFSNTYAPLETLRSRYEEALSHPDIRGLVIGTRPDCIDEEKLAYIASLQRKDPLNPEAQGKIIQIEYGIESCYDSTLKRINRGHDFQTAACAIALTRQYGLHTCAHFILGLPGETPQMLLDQCSKINSLGIDSVKFHQLQIIKGTAMEKEKAEHPEDFTTWSLEEYLDLIIDILERLRPDIAIERVAGEVPPRFVEKPQWGLIRNFQILHLLDKRLEERGSWQGKLLSEATI